MATTAARPTQGVSGIEVLLLRWGGNLRPHDGHDAASHFRLASAALKALLVAC
jgi:hypothetical protein